MEKRKETMSHLERRHYLVGKMIDGAEALRKLFVYDAQRPLFFRFNNPERYCEKASKKHMLTANQKECLLLATRRLWRAHEFVQTAKKRFGKGPNGKIRDAKSLFESIYPNEIDKSSPNSAKAMPYWIVFYLEEDHFLKNVNGNVRYEKAYLEPESHSLNMLLHSAIDKRYAIICSRINHKSESYKENRAQLGGEYTERHELKHIIDHITKPRNYLIGEETSACIFSYGAAYSGLFGDLDKMDKLTEEKESMHRSELKLLTDFIIRKVMLDERPELSHIVLDRLNKEIHSSIDENDRKDKESIYRIFSEEISDPDAKLRNILSEVRKCDYDHKEAKRSLASLLKIDQDLLFKMATKRMDHEVLSFIVSATPAAKLHRRISFLDDYLKG